LQAVVDEGILGLSPAVLKMFKLRSGGKVRIFTRYGEATATVKTMHELTGGSGILKPNGQDGLILSPGTNLEGNMINARIEKA